MRSGWRQALALLALTSAAHPCLADDKALARVKQSDLHASVFYPSQAGNRVPGILVLGGAEGGDVWAKAVAQRLAEHGYAALAEAYFNIPGLEAQLQEIPIERLKRGVAHLTGDPRVDARHIAVLGLSKGAEAAMVLASNDQRIKAIVAGSPSDVVWQGIDRKAGAVRSSWTLDGRPLPFVSFAACPDCRSRGALYARSREAPEARSAAAIPIEKANGPILMLASERDAVWPSQAMAETLQARLNHYHFRYPVVLLRYPDGGHFTLGPLAEQDAASDADFGGGTAAGVVAARRDSWPQVLAFLDKALRFEAPARGAEIQD